MSAQPKMQYSLEEYFELDRKSDERLELWNGEIFSMSGVSREHATVEMNVSITLGSRLRAKGCQLSRPTFASRFPACRLIVTVTFRRFAATRNLKKSAA